MKKIATVKQPMIGLYHLPVVLVSCIDKDGKPNIIPLGWVGGVCSDPPQVSIALRPSRYSHQMIEQTGEFVVNIPEEGMVEIVDGTGFCSGRNVDKFKEFNLTPLQSSKVKPPLIKECPVNLECKLRHSLNLGSHTLFIGEIVAVQVEEEYWKEDGEIDYMALRPLMLRHDEYIGPGPSHGFYGFTKFGERVVNRIF
jgi:flavin reductase (DIM6/NTAB) family NADH-FMN oxidoreductase RutF